MLLMPLHVAMLPPLRLMMLMLIYAIIDAIIDDAIIDTLLHATLRYYAIISCRHVTLRYT